MAVRQNTVRKSAFWPECERPARRHSARFLLFGRAPSGRPVPAADLLEALVDDALGFLLAAREEAKFDDVDERREADAALHGLGNLLLERLEVVGAVGLHVDAHAVAPVEVRDADLVFAGKLGEEAEDFLDLLREDVDALDLHHVVAAPGDDVDAREPAAAGAGAGDDPREVVGAEADEGRPLLDEGGDDDFAGFAVGDVLAGRGVDDLEVEVVVPVVHARVEAAVDADAGAVDLGEAVDVVDFDNVKSEQIIQNFLDGSDFNDPVGLRHIHHFVHPYDFMRGVNGCSSDIDHRSDVGLHGISDHEHL